MERVANILGAVTEGRQQLRRPAPTLSEGSRPLRNNLQASEYTIHPEEAKAQGYSYNEEPPEPEICQFCGKPLFHYGAIMPNQKRVFTWFSEAERCDCPGAKEHWARVDAEKQAREAEEAKRRQQEIIRRRVAKLLADSGMGGRFQTRTFERFTVNEENRRAFNAAKRYADSFSLMLPQKDDTGRVTPPQKERNGLFISGTKGTGKTHLAAAIANQLIQGGVPVICMTMIDLLSRIKETFDGGKGASEAEILRIYKDVPLLIIDDIGTEQPTEWGLSKIYTIINARYESYMPTVITTNYSGDELIRRMTPERDDGYTAAKTIDRLLEMCAGIEMTWESWRDTRRRRST